MRKFLTAMTAIIGIAFVCYSCANESGKTLSLKELKSIKKRVLESNTRNILAQLDLKKLNPCNCQSQNISHLYCGGF